MNQHDIIAKIIQQVLSNIPGGPLLQAFVGEPIANWLSPQSSMANQFIWPGASQTMGQTAINYLENMRQSGFNSGANIFNGEQKIRALIAYNKMLHPDWDENTLRGAAENMADNPFNIVSGIYSSLDPLGANAGAAAARDTATILHRRGSDFSLRGATYARSISNAIYGYRGTDGKHVDGILNDVIENPSEYGNLSAASVMQLGKELALTDQMGFTDATGKGFDSSRFREKLKSISSAIVPWTDIFGKDIPNLLTQLEALTGTSLGASSADLNSMGHRMASILSVTGAKIQHIAAYKEALSKSLVDPEMSNRSILGAAAVAGDLTLGLSNLSLNSMTTQELQGSAARFFAGTAKSTYADRFGLAYAKWADANPGGTLQEFRNKLREAGDAGMDIQGALLSVSGAKSIHDLEMYRHSDAFLRAAAEGAGADMAGELNIGRAMSFVRDRFDSRFGSGYNESVSKAMKDMSNEDLMRFLGSSVDQQVEQIMKWAENDPSAAPLDKEKARIIQKNIGSIATRATSTSGENEARSRFAVAYNKLRQGKQAEQLANFSKAVYSLQGPGGFVGVYNQLKNAPDSDVSELIKTFTGGVDMLDPLFKMFNEGAFTEEEIKANDATFRAGTNFITNNFAEFGEGGAYSDIREMIQSGDKSKMLRGFRLASAMDAVGSAAIGKLSDGELKAFKQSMGSRIDKLQKEGKLSDANLKREAKDLYIDTRLSDGLRVDGLSEHGDASRALITKLKSGTYASRAEYLEAYKESIKGKSKEEQDSMLSDFNKMWKASGIGDIDGVDPIYKMASMLEKIPELLQDLIGAVSNNNNNNRKPGGK